MELKKGLKEDEFEPLPTIINMLRNRLITIGLSYTEVEKMIEEIYSHIMS